MKFLKKHKIEIYLFALAIVLRLIFFWFNIQAHDKDLLPTILRSESYFEIANNIIAGNGFSGDAQEPFRPQSIRAPIYPLFIAAILIIFGTYWAVMIIQIIIGSILAILSKRICYYILEDKKIAIGVGIFFAVEPLLVRLSSVLLTETLFLAFFFGFLLALYKYFDSENFFHLVLGAVLLALATLTRPITQYLPVFIIVFIVWYFRKKLSWRVGKHIAGFILIFLIVLSPWLYRNYRVFDSPSITVTRTINLYAYFIPSIFAIENNISYNEAKIRFFAEENISGIDGINLETAGPFDDRSMEILKERPFGILKVVALTTVSLFTHDGYLDVVQDLGYLNTGLPSIPVFKIIQSPKLALSITGELIKSPGIIIVFGRIFWILMTFLMVVGIVKHIRFKGLRQSKFLISLLILAYFAATTTIVGLGVTARYRTPINIFIVCFAFYAISRQKSGEKHRVDFLP